MQKTDALGAGTNYNSEPNEIKMAIQNAVNVALFLHRSPDLDSLCSNIAMHTYLDSIKKPHTLFSIDKVPNAYDLMDTSFIKANEDPAKLDFSSFDLVIGIDMAAPSVSTQDKTFSYPELGLSNKKLLKINIDHHDNSFWGDINFSFPHRNSACSVLYSLFKEIGFTIDSQLANVMLLGHLADTGVFQNQLTSEDLRVSADLIDKGAQGSKLIWFLNFNLDYLAFKRRAYVLSKTTFDKDRNIAYSSLSLKENQDLGISPELDVDMNGKEVQDIRRIKGINFAMFFKEKSEKRVTVSFRSNNPDFDVSKIAVLLGGGGHKNAAAAMIPDSTLDEAIKYTLKVIDAYNERSLED